MANNLFPHTLFEQNFKIQADLQGPLVIIFLFFYNYQTLALLTLATQGYILQNIRIFPFSRFSWFLCRRNFDIPSLMFTSRNVSKPSLLILVLFTEMHALVHHGPWLRLLRGLEQGRTRPPWSLYTSPWWAKQNSKDPWTPPFSPYLFKNLLWSAIDLQCAKVCIASLATVSQCWRGWVRSRTAPTKQ